MLVASSSRRAAPASLKKYVNKMTKAAGVKTAARWAQVEHAVDSAIDLQIASELPLFTGKLHQIVVTKKAVR